MAPKNPNQQGAKITLYWLNKSRAQRIVWLLEELELDYELKVFHRGEDKLAPRELKDIHPLGKSPVVAVQAAGAEKPIILAESGTIVEYLTEHFGRSMVPQRYPDGQDGGVGAETEEWLKYRYLMHYAEGSFMTIFIVALVISNIRKAPVPFFIKPITRTIADKVDGAFVAPNMTSHLSFLEDYVEASPGGPDFLCGSNLTGADIMIIFVLEAAIALGTLTEANHSKLYSWVRKMQARDAYKRGGERVSEATGEPYVAFSEDKF